MNHYASNMYRDRAGRHYWFADQLKKRGHEVTVFCANTYLNGEYAIALEKEKFAIREERKYDT